MPKYIELSANLDLSVEEIFNTGKPKPPVKEPEKEDEQEK